MERETEEILLPVSGKKAVVKAYFTAREKITVNRLCAKSAKIDTDGETRADAEMIIEFQNEMARIGLVSLDDKTEDCFERLLDLRFEDYRAVVEAIISNDTREIEKKTIQ